MVVERCHAASVWRSSGVRRIVSEVFRPRGITILKVTNTHRGQGACNTSPVVSSGEEHAYSRGIEYEKGGHRSTRLERAWQDAKGRCHDCHMAPFSLGEREVKSTCAPAHQTWSSC